MDGTEDDIIWDEEAASDGDSDVDSDGDMLYPDSDEESSTRIFLGLTEKLHQTQTVLFRATNPQDIRTILV